MRRHELKPGLDPVAVARELLKLQASLNRMCDADRTVYDSLWRVEEPTEGKVAQELRRLRYALDVGAVDPDHFLGRSTFVEDWRLLAGPRRRRELLLPLCARNESLLPVVA